LTIFYQYLATQHTITPGVKLEYKKGPINRKILQPDFFLCFWEKCFLHTSSN